MHVNVRSLHHNLSGLTNFLVTVNLRFSFIGITETWLRDFSHNSDIPGYKFIRKHLDFLKVARFSLNGPGTNDFYHLQHAKFTGGIFLL